MGTTRCLKPVETEPDSLPPELALRIAKNPPHPHRRRYIAYDDGEPVGLLAIDTQPFFLYEVYVVRSRRRAGIGGWLLNEGDKIAAELGERVIRVRPSPLDTGIKPENLVLWYLQHGYAESDQVPGALEKRLS
jgi:GNAT superfamily N-acetyltransferase